MFFFVLIVCVTLMRCEAQSPITGYRRAAMYENEDCTGRVIYDQIEMIGHCDPSKMKQGCFGSGSIEECVREAKTPLTMPNWVLSERSALDKCGTADSRTLKVEGFLTGCFNFDFNSTCVWSSKFVCESGNQMVLKYMSDGCTGEPKSIKKLGVATKFDHCARTRHPYVWDIVHCEPKVEEKAEEERAEDRGEDTEK